MCTFHLAAFVVDLRMFTFLLGQFSFDIWFSETYLYGLIQTDYEVKVPYHWRRHRVFLDCLIHLLQIPIRTAMDGWKLKFSGLIDGWSYLNVCTGFLLLGSMDRILGQHV